MSEDINPAAGPTPAGGYAADIAGAGSGIRRPSTANYPGPGGAAPDLGEGGAGLDDTDPTPATSDQPSSPAASATGAPGTSPSGAGGKAAAVAGVAAERGSQVGEVARHEVTRVADEARTQLTRLWSQASEQLGGQADAGRQQLAGLLHSLAAELGEMAARSNQDGPLTALARQGSLKCGEWSHWLASSDLNQLMVQVRRFARRRPVVFLAGALTAGVVVGRLGRSLMAGEPGQQHAEPSTSPMADPGYPAGTMPVSGGQDDRA